MDLVFANCQNHCESAPSYVYNPDGTHSALPGQGSVCGMTLDIDVNGYDELIHREDLTTRTTVYWGSHDGLHTPRIEKVVIELDLGGE